MRFTRIRAPRFVLWQYFHNDLVQGMRCKEWDGVVRVWYRCQRGWLVGRRAGDGEAIAGEARGIIFVEEHAGGSKLTIDNLEGRPVVQVEQSTGGAQDDADARGPVQLRFGAAAAQVVVEVAVGRLLEHQEALRRLLLRAVALDQADVGVRQLRQHLHVCSPVFQSLHHENDTKHSAMSAKPATSTHGCS